jgi:predicted MFS family arabinose efflux permease
LSTSLAGYAMDRFGAAAAFGALASIALGGLASIWLSLPETHPGRSPSSPEIADRPITDPRALLQT